MAQAARLWVDANVILRFLTKDPSAMAKRAAKLMEKAESGEVTLLVSPLVLAEVIWVLKSFYHYPILDISKVLLLFISAPGIETFERELIIRAIELARDKIVDFADAYLALQALRQDETVCTFDETDFKRLPAKWVLP